MRHPSRMIRIGRVVPLALAILGCLASTAHALTTVTFTSKQPGTIKIAVYNPGDAVQAIPLKTWEVNPGTSAHWDDAPRTFHVKVFKPQLVDRLLASRNNVPYNSTVTIGADLSINFAARKSLVFQNSSDEQLKFAVYNSGDSAMAIPFKTWTISKGGKVTWPEAPATFHLKVFKPAIIDQLVATQRTIADRKSVVVTRSGATYRVAVQ